MCILGVPFGIGPSQKRESSQQSVASVITATVRLMLVGTDATVRTFWILQRLTPLSVKLTRAHGTWA
jgi:hypothetical protein